MIISQFALTAVPASIEELCKDGKELLFTKAVTDYDFGKSASGKRIHAAARWYVANEPSRSGSFGIIESMIVT